MIMVPVRRRNFSLRVPAPCGENRFAREFLPVLPKYKRVREDARGYRTAVA